MLQKFVAISIAFLLHIGAAFAQVEVNKADQAALDGIKGVGPSLSKAILEERKKGGDFKDWLDFEGRVKGVGEKNAIKLSNAGLTVNGKGRTNTVESLVKDEKKPNKEMKKVSAKEEVKK